ncbi:tetrahydrofolate dehydrogenase/cyclohydrolase catalytic domain-containing protein [Streptomyces sp. CRN 30]|uniref:tetrahydrofolate dehydrogenase/cyclohydrolase catalytic domain-containing protein n=1 Tax=Streptomyces sp. CRN 30 TaxID=3075613 RepID=UPI002A83E539|nr:tetrahydrofolate dehydrogenase/cyclohydrolase catalytic domain-containing protein [Streptomyces sp. CRN 30]
MPARIATGQTLKRTLIEQAARSAEEAGITPTVALVRVSHDDPMLPVNFRLHQELFGEAGFRVRPYELAEDTDWETLRTLIEQLNADDDVDVILVLIPLPEHLDIRSVLAAIAPAKEAEGLHLDHVMRLNPLSALPATRIPVVPTAVVHLLDAIGYDPDGHEVVVLTDPDLTETNPVAKMVARIAAFAALPPNASGCVVPVTHPRARELARSADLLVVSLQRPAAVTAEWIKPGAVVIDFNPIFTGFRPSRKHPGREVPHLVGGVEVDSASTVAGVIVPAPGGVGPVMLGALAQQIVTTAVSRRAEHVAPSAA